MDNFWKNASIMGIAEIFLKLKAVIMLPFITKYLGTVNYGIWSQVMVIVSLAAPLVFCGTDNSISRFLPGKPLDEQKRQFTGWLLFGFVTSFIILLFIYLAKNAISGLFFGYDEQYSMFVLLAGLNVLTTAMLTGIRNWFRVQDQAWSLTTLTVMQNLIQMGVLITILFSKLGIYELVLWSTIIDVLIILGYIFYLSYKKVFRYPSIDWLIPYLRFGVVFLPSGYAVWVLNSVDRVFLAQYHTMADIGIYSICFTIGYTLIQVVVNPIWNLFFTRASKLYNTDKISELDRLFNQSIKLICWIIFPAILGLTLTGERLLIVVSTAEFAKGYLVIPIILSGYLCLMLSAYFESILVLKNKPFLSTVFTFIACIVNIVLNFALIPKFSYMGAALATTLSFMLQLTISMMYALKENLIKLDFEPIKKIFLASTIMVIASFIFKMYLPSQIYNIAFLVLITVFGSVIYLALTQILKIYRFNELARNFNYVAKS